MKALRFEFSLPRLAYSKILGTFYKGAYFDRFSALRYADIPEPELPGHDWVKVRTVYCGICASDMHAILLNGSLDNPTQPFISFPMVLGHEIVGTVEEVGRKVDGLNKEERVLIYVMLSCVPRGIDPPCPACQEGDTALCRNFAEGNLPPGLLISTNSKVNGGFAPFVVAHHTQCFKIPEGVSFVEAVLGDPFGVSLHAIMQNPPRPGDRVLVYGLGTLGLSAIIALRTLYPECCVVAAGRHEFQKELAVSFGAHEVVEPGPGIFQDVAKITGGKVYQVRRGKPILMGGVDIVYDCVGSADTIETSLRLTREKGQVILIGADTPKRFEWSPLWLRDISLKGSMAIGANEYKGQKVHTFDIFLELLKDKKIDVKPLITHIFRLEQYKEALKTCMNKKSTKSIKVLFDLT
ncbi:MAG TPA: alcohol dehydrogenase catalytic domain-containing protein [Dehalococcoidia bacterium]|nr:alcohol dehydrogenase catalytic domain-containing protein [Dehalococcoidia bacterium]